MVVIFADKRIEWPQAGPMSTYWIKRHIEEQTDIIIGEHAIMIVNGVPGKWLDAHPGDVVEFCGEYEKPKTMSWIYNKDGTKKKYRHIDDEGEYGTTDAAGS